MESSRLIVDAVRFTGSNLTGMCLGLGVLLFAGNMILLGIQRHLREIRDELHRLNEWSR